MRAKNAVASRAKRKGWIKRAKGFWGQRKSNIRRVKETVRRAMVYATRDRRMRKREFRSLWIARLNGALRPKGLIYRDFIHQLKVKNILLSRDMLAWIAAEKPAVFDKIVEITKN